ncbi:MAG: phospholipase [Microbacteriaceae bacterium]
MRHPHTPVRRRTLGVVAACAGVALGAVTLAGLTSNLPLSGAVAASVSRVIATASPVPPAAGPLAAVADDAADQLADARSAVRAADAVAADASASGLDLAIETTVDTGALEAQIDRLADADLTPVLLLPEIVEDADQETLIVEQRVATIRAVLDGELAQKAAAEAAAEAQRQAEAEAAAAAAAAEALAQANTPEGAQATARQMAAERYGWGEGEFSCLVSLWNKESSWNYQAYNASSGATGIPQALPGSKMAASGADWQTNAATQVSWGLDYIARAYGAPCSAWGHSQATNWY